MSRLKVVTLVCEPRDSGAELMGAFGRGADSIIELARKVRSTGLFQGVQIARGIVTHTERPLAPIMKFVCPLPAVEQFAEDAAPFTPAKGKAKAGK